MRTWLCISKALHTKKVKQFDDFPSSCEWILRLLFVTSWKQNGMSISIQTSDKLCYSAISKLHEKPQRLWDLFQYGLYNITLGSSMAYKTNGSFSRSYFSKRRTAWGASHLRLSLTMLLGQDVPHLRWERTWGSFSQGCKTSFYAFLLLLQLF